MASKSALLGGTRVKVQNVSGFDKSRFNAFTAPLGAIVPMAKQLLIPGKFNVRVKVSAQLPPLATDAFLRTHLKVEAFLIPLRQCYGGFQSWFSGEKILTGSSRTGTIGVAKLPFLSCRLSAIANVNTTRINRTFGPHSLMDYFGVKFPLSSGAPDVSRWPLDTQSNPLNLDFNIFPFVAYQLCYDKWFRNKLIQRPLFAPPSADGTSTDRLPHLPYESYISRQPFVQHCDNNSSATTGLMNLDLLQLRQRNYGFDYFTTAMPSPQDGNAMTVSTSGNVFTIKALREANALQHFAEVNQVAGPDYIQVCRARYGKAPSSMVAQKPILLGSADFPMYTSGVEQTSQYTSATPNGNPMAGMAARYGRAHAEGSDFVCSGECDEPAYLMVMCSLVPEANYASGIAKDMMMFTEEGSIVDLPNSQLELTAPQEVLCRELYFPTTQWSAIFGYQPRYMWHKAGAQNEVHGLFRKGASLESFIPQRDFDSVGTPPVQINSAFLEVAPTDLDNVTAVSGAISQYGVMIDSSIEIRVSEPLGEGELPALADPAAEHGRSVYLTRGATIG